MKTNGKQKEFDAVKTMREIRDQVSREIQDMTFAEEKSYLKRLIKLRSKRGREPQMREM